MPLVTAQSLISASVRWKYTVPLIPFTPRYQSDTLTWSFTPGVIYNHVFHYSGTLAVSSDTTIDFYGPNTMLSGESVTATKLAGFWLRCTGNGGVLLIEPGDTNPLAWPFDTDLTITPGAGQGGWDYFDGTGVTVSSSAKTWKLSNTGTVDLEIALIAFVGT